MSKLKKIPNDKVCCFCGLSEDNELLYGKFYEHDTIITHYYCLLLSANMQQKGKDNQGILGFLIKDIRKEISRGKRLTCSYCKKPGATLRCCNVKCTQKFHYPCGLRAGSLNQFFGQFRSYCKKHRPNKKMDTRLRKELVKSNDAVCYICYDNLNPCDVINIIWAPCCQKKTWFHKNCIQKLAISAGYFFKCPLCNDKKVFHKAMLQDGIFIPRQDASWELVPNAFEELLYRHDQCDAPVCLCPKGRKYASFNAKWQLILCQTCGSQGIHTGCRQLKSYPFKLTNTSWKCKECSSILGKSEENSNLCNDEDSSTYITPQNLDPTACTLQNRTESEDSDSDISVGKYSPVPFASDSSSSCSTSQMPSIPLRPGPRTFKLRLLSAYNDVKNISINNNKKEENVDSIASITSHNDKLDNNNDIMEISSKTSVNITHIASDKNTFNNLFANDSIKIEETNVAHDCSSNVIRQTSNTKEHHITNITSSFDDTETNVRKVNSLPPPYEEICDNLGDAIKLYSDPAYNYLDDISNIKITNIMSLAPEEFENLMPSKEKGKLDAQNGNECLTSTSVSQSSTEVAVLDKHLKRKRDKDQFDITTSPSERYKKMRLNVNVLRDKQRSLFSITEDTDHHSLVHDLSSAMLNEDSITPCNNKRKNISTHYLSNNNLPFEGAHVVSNDETDENNSVTSTGNEAKDCVSVDILGNKTTESMNIENCSRDCDGDAGTSPVDESHSRGCTNSAWINCAKQFDKSAAYHSIHNRPNRPNECGKRTRDSTETEATSKQGESNAESIDTFGNKLKNDKLDYETVIPEYIRLQDLKFRVHNSNTLQMILYHKFSVNINIESTGVVKNARSDVVLCKTVEQDSPKIQYEDPTNIKSDDTLYSTSISNRDKCKYSILQNNASEHYHDDVKENLDPVTTISCKNALENFYMNSTLPENNIIASTSNNTQSKEEKIMQSPHNVSKVFEENNIRSDRDDVNLVKTVESTSDIKEYSNITSGVTTDRYCKTINNIKENIQILSSDHVTSSADEEYSAKTNANSDFHDSIKVVQPTILLENHSKHTTQNDAKSMNKAYLKVSIDLEKIENILDDNPDIFSNCEEKDYKRRLEQVNFSKMEINIAESIGLLGRCNTRLLRDEPKNFRNFRTFFPDNTKECKNSNEDTPTEHIKREVQYASNLPSYSRKRDFNRSINRLRKTQVVNR